MQFGTFVSEGSTIAFLLGFLAVPVVHASGPESEGDIDEPTGAAPIATTPTELRDRGEAERPPIELFPSGPLRAAVGEGPDRAPSEPGVASEEILDRWADGRLEADRIGVGQVDGWYYGMRQAMRSSFRPDPRALQRDRAGPLEPVRRVIDELSRYAAPRQQPIDSGASPQTLWSRSREDDATRDEFDQLNPLYAPMRWYRVELRVVHGRSGQVSELQVSRSSGMQSLDAAAVAAVGAGASAVPAPPDTVVGEQDSFVSEWAFEVGDIATNVRAIAVMQGPTGQGAQVAVLGRGAIRTSVQLLGVTDATHRSFDARRAARRRARPR